MADDLSHDPSLVSPDIVQRPLVRAGDTASSPLYAGETASGRDQPPFLDRSACCIYVKDELGRYVMANTTAATALEMEADALSGLTDVDLANMGCMTIDEATRIRAADDQVRVGGQPLIAEETITREGRRWHFYSIKSR
jgi:hypothetical protein